jgi:hypothetical protein
MEHGSEIVFRKSTFSGANGQCVEVAFVDNGARPVMMRDSKHRSGAVLQFTPSEWDAFVKGVHAGEFG